MNTPRLVTIKFSHYAEKARWALEHHGIAYDEDYHAPLLHWRAASKTGAGHTVPILVTDSAVIPESADIVAWADTHGSGPSLFPESPAERAEVESLIEEYDSRLGPATRRILYFYLLQHRTVALQMMKANAPKNEVKILPFAFPIIRTVIRKAMKIDAAGAKRSAEVVREVFDATAEQLADGRPFLVGDRFSAADLTFASLAYPLISTPGYGASIPEVETMPAEIQAVFKIWRAHPAAAHVYKMFASHRTP